MAVEVLRRRFTVDEYYRMAEAGILSEDDRVELIEGEIVEMPPIGSPHASVVDRLAAALLRGLPGGEAIVRVQNPVRLTDLSEPVPDLAILRFRPDYYVNAHPGPADVILLIEVADTTFRYDQEVKIPLYARSEIPEAWVVDLNAEQVHVYRRPTAGGYEEQRSAGHGEWFSAQALPEVHLAVDEILG